MGKKKFAANMHIADILQQCQLRIEKLGMTAESIKIVTTDGSPNGTSTSGLVPFRIAERIEISGNGEAVIRPARLTAAERREQRLRKQYASQPGQLLLEFPA